MPFTFKPTLKPEPKQDGTHAVRARVTKDRKVAYYTTGIYVKAKHWNPKASYEKENWLKGYPMQAVDNAAFRDDLDGLKILGNAYPTLTASELVALYKARKDGTEAKAAAPDFLEVFRKEVERKHELTASTLDVYASLYNTFAKYCGGSLPMPRLTVGFLKDYVYHLQTVGNRGTKEEPRPASAVTIQTYLGILSSVAKAAMLEKLLDYSDNPFHHIKDILKGKVVRKKKQPLTRDTLQKMAQLDLSTHADPLMEVARDMYLVQFYLHGSRGGDVLELKVSDVSDRVRFTMRKTRKGKSVVMTDALAGILAKYLPKEGEQRLFLFPLLDEGYLLKDKFMQKRARDWAKFRINERLGLIAELLEVDRFTMHTARHSFANAAVEGKTDLRLLQSMLNHSSVSTTENYIRDFIEGEDDTQTNSIYGVKHQ